MMKRIFDISLALILIIIILIPALLIALFIKLTSPGPVLYWSDRVGLHNRLFSMAKFRMHEDKHPRSRITLIS